MAYGTNGFWRMLFNEEYINKTVDKAICTVSTV